MLVVTDADNTLWDTNSVYRDAQLAYFDEVLRLARVNVNIDDRLAYLRNIDQAIAAKHKDHFRYPPFLLAEALYSALLTEAGQNAKQAEPAILSALTTAAEHFGGRVSTTVPELRKGVREGLAGLQKANARIVIVTEGPAERCKALLESHQLDATIEVLHVPRKGVVVYKQLVDGSDDRPRVAIGDQIEKDLFPAKEAGFVTVYFPSDLKFRWSGNDKQSYVDFKIDSYADVLNVVRNLAGGVVG